MAAAFAFARRNQRKDRFFRKRIVSLEDLSDKQVVERYRLTREAIFHLVDTIGESLLRRSQRSQAVPPITQVLIGLRLLGKGDFFSEVADLHGVSKSTVCVVFEAVLDAINESIDNIRFPQTRDQQYASKIEFYRKCRIPGVLGAVDGTLVPIIAPAQQEEVYRCRKGYHALNIQAVVNSNLRFIDVVSKWPGSQHDSAIFNSCGLKVYLEENGVGLLLGDSGYPLRPYLLTPKLQPSTVQEVRFNSAHKSGRVVVERAFGLLKSRFRCLHKTGGCMMYSPGKCARIVLACAKLHNLCLDWDIPLPDGAIVIDPDDDDINAQHGDAPATANAMRNQIIRLF